MPARAGEKHHKARLTEWDVLDIRAMYAAGGHTYLSLATQYDVEVGTISCVIRGTSWSWLTGGEPVKAPPRGLATHCHKEHEFTPDNIIWIERADRPNPSRQCRRCKYDRSNAWRRAKRGNR